MSDKKQAAVRPYRVLQDHGGGKITRRLVAAATQAQAIGYVTKNTFAAEAVGGLDVAKLMNEGVVLEYASDDAPVQDTGPGTE